MNVRIPLDFYETAYLRAGRLDRLREGERSVREAVRPEHHLTEKLPERTFKFAAVRKIAVTLPDDDTLCMRVDRECRAALNFIIAPLIFLFHEVYPLHARRLQDALDFSADDRKAVSE